MMNKNNDLEWFCLPFAQLTTGQLYDLLKLRVDVFVVEQECPYPELDNHDRQADVHHLLGYHEGQLVACARLLPAGVTYPSVSLGRIAIDRTFRGNGSGHLLVAEALEQADRLWPNENIKIGAQSYLTRFYRQFGFVQVSEEYLEDNIPHIDMVLDKSEQVVMS
ncbi:GNAT family N-acetyltransferase [Spongorhabdus nitratireducens]